MDIRPLYLVFAAWFLVLLGLASFLLLAFDFSSVSNPEYAQVFLGNGLPKNERLVLNLVSFAVLMITGKFMLDGANWARIVYVAWIVLWLGFSYYKNPDEGVILPGAAFHGAVIVLLFLPAANRYFLSKYKWP